MSEEEFEEQNLDEFLKNAAEILIKNEEESKNSMIESLYEHLKTVFKDKNESENFFTLLNNIIFLTNDSESKKSFNKQPFILYPIIYSYNKKESLNYIKYFLASLQQSISEENKPHFSFLISVFSNFIICFFNSDNKDKNISSSDSASNDINGEEKQVLFEKLFNYCNNNIKTNKKLEQYFGFLLLSELIEKCPLVQEEKNIDLIFKDFVIYLKDRLFECKLDLLNCIITLILTVNKKFNPHARVCLFNVLDFLTDHDLEQKKLAINIVYIIVIYCTENIMAVKDNLIEFLKSLNEEKDPRVREVYLQTLKFIEETDKKNRKNKGVNNNINDDKNINSINDNYSPLQYEEKKMDISEDSHSQPSHFSSIGMERNESSSTNCKKSNLNISKSKNSFNNKASSKLSERNNQYNSNNNTNGIIMGSNNNKRFNKSTEQRGYGNKGENNKIKNVKKIEKKIVKHETNTNFRDGFKKEKYLKEFEQQNNERKMKQSQLSLNMRPNNLSSNYRKNIAKIPSLKNQINNKNKTRKSEISKNKNSSINNNISNNTNNNINNNINNNDDDKFNKIMEQLNIIQLSQNNLIEVVNNLKNTVDMNYLNLDKRIKKLENCQSSKEENFIDDEKKFELIMNKYNSGQYDDAINEAFDNDKYFYKLLPLIVSENITKINLSIIEKIIAKLNLDLPKLCKEEGQNNNINSILSFFNQLIRSKININLIPQVNIKDTLQTVKTDFNTKLSQNDNTTIDIILKSLKV
jgi:hypothetical protein